jgi:low temperature requirement protein LtrA
MFPPFLLSLIVGLVIVGLVLWVIQQIPMDPVIARIVRVVIIVCVVLWLLSVLLGYGGGLAFGSYPMRR